MKPMKPILFSTLMVQAILAGRKTMTRRVMNPQPRPENSYFGGQVTHSADKKLLACVGFSRSALAVADYDYAKQPYRTGDILYVRETWFGKDDWFAYKADNPEPDFYAPWRSPATMPRAAARIFLRVTDVRCERVQEILCGDMKREGCIPATVTGGQYQQWQRDYFIPLWDSRYAKRGFGWDDNPYVWVISFERIEKPQEEGSDNT